MTHFTERVVQIIQSIPAGKVMTYGQIATLAGNRRGARQVARILHSMSKKHQLPWHRVINAKGEIVISDTEGTLTQKELLLQEGVLVLGNKIRLEDYRYYPTVNWVPEDM